MTIPTFYLDCEFNGFGGEFISLALVSKNEEIRFYEVSDEITAMALHPWVKTNVIPVLFKKPIPIDHIRIRLGKFLQRHAVGNQLRVVADWPEDIMHLCKLLITGPGQSVPTPNILFELDRTSLPSTAQVSMTPHNALEDALAMARSVTSS